MNIMIIGKGLIGKGLEKIDCKEYVFFASGVSNSKSTDNSEFSREINLVEKALDENGDKCIIYFSSTSINDQSVNTNPYINHKLEVEKLIRQKAKSYLVIRTGNIVGDNANKNTIFSFLLNSVKNSIPFILWKNSYRNFLHIEDFVKMVDYALNILSKRNEVICLINPKDINILNLVELMEMKLKTKGIFAVEEKGSSFDTDKSLSIYIFHALGLEGVDYEEKLIEKYYSE